MVSRWKTNATTSNEATVFTAGLLAVTLVLLASTFGLHPSSALVPRVVGTPLAVLLGYRLFREIGTQTGGREAGHGTQPASRSDEIGAVLWFLALPALSTLFGFVAGPALFVFTWARYRGGERLVTAAAAGALIAAVILVLFTRVLGAPLWQGVLGGLF